MYSHAYVFRPVREIYGFFVTVVAKQNNKYAYNL